VRPFYWSGSNSHTSRISAGKELAQQLRGLINRRPGLRIHLIAHSHGGNVILYALEEPGISAHVCSISFLGTPFIEAARRDLVPAIEFFSAAIIGLLVFPGLLPLSGLAIGEGPRLLLLNIFGIELPALFYLACWAGAVYVIKKAFFPLLNSRHRTAEALKAILISHQREKLKWLQTRAPHQPIFLATVKGDEAARLLWLWHLGTEWPKLLFGGLKKVLFPVWIGLFVIGFVMVGIARTLCAAGIACKVSYEDLFGMGVMAALCASALTVVLPAVAIFVSMLRGSFLAFGWEGLLGHMVLRIEPVVSPSWALPLGSKRFDLSVMHRALLRHSLFYGDKVLIQELATWMTRARTNTGGDQGS
jgi:hypothetical protein